jgi:hypothetical protein
VSAIYHWRTARKHHTCLQRYAHVVAIKPGDRYVAAAVTPNDETYGVDRWWRSAICSECASKDSDIPADPKAG